MSSGNYPTGYGLFPPWQANEEHDPDDMDDINDSDGEGETCRFCGHDMLDFSDYGCEKCSPHFGVTDDMETEEISV